MGKPPSVDFYDLQMEVFPFLYNRKLRSLLYKNAPRDAHSREEEIGRQGDRARRESSASGTLCSFIGNSNFYESKKKHMFIEHMLDKHVFRHEKKTVIRSENIKTFFSEIIIVKWVIFI